MRETGEQASECHLHPIRAIARATAADCYQGRGIQHIAGIDVLALALVQSFDRRAEEFVRQEDIAGRFFIQCNVHQGGEMSKLCVQVVI
jgi:hypothetical protein